MNFDESTWGDDIKAVTYGSSSREKRKLHLQENLEILLHFLGSQVLECHYIKSC